MLALVVAGAGVAGCGDLVFSADRIPTVLAVSPADTLVRVGARVHYSLAVLDQNGDTIDAPPSWAKPVWTASSETAIRVSPDGWAVDALEGPEVDLTVSLAGLVARAELRINPADVVLTVPAVHMTQGIQDRDGSVPLVAGRQALLRVFVKSDRISFYRPRVHAVFWLGDKLLHNAQITLGAETLPDTVDEGRLTRSYNAIVPPRVMQPGLEMVIQLEGDVPLAQGSQSRIPEEGRVPIDVRSVAPMDLTLVPVLVPSASSDLVLDWTQDATPESDQLGFARAVLPIGDLNTRVREPFVTTADLTTGSGWGKLLGELTFLYAREGSRGYYYGAVEPPSGSKWTGLGYIGRLPISVGAPDAKTFAHELGHNLGLRHAPCGGASSSDTAFPYEGGGVGTWGYDFRSRQLVDPSLFKDVMGYCQPSWVSDYHFAKALSFRLETEVQGWDVMPLPTRPDEKTLVLWGSAGPNDLYLEPAFVLDDMQPLVPADSGPYTLEGLGPRGERRFRYAFAPSPVEYGGGRFLFAVPYDRDASGPVAQIVLAGPEGSFVLDESDAAERVALVTDRATGRLRGILRGPVPGDGTAARPSVDGSGGADAEEWWERALNNLEGTASGGLQVTVSGGLPAEIRE